MRTPSIGGLGLLLLLQACAAQTPAPPAPQASEEAMPSLKLERYTLPNGLEVILQHDDRLPLVTVNLWYHVGAINEQPGLFGFAHLFEHMMFQGSPNVGKDQFIKLLEQIGGTHINGSTTFDRTNYFETVPASELETVLWMESDRMGFLLDSLTEADLKNQIDVVQNERRQTVDNRPYGLAEERLTQLLYPAPHPYFGDVIGSMKDIAAAKLSDVQAFFKRYYTPANATLTIAGDFETKTTKSLIERYFGSLKGAPKPKRPELSAPKLDLPITVTLEEPIGKLNRIVLAWPLPPRFHKDSFALELLAHVISGTRSSRLDRKVSFESKIAENVTAYTLQYQAGGRFIIDLRLKPGVSLDEGQAAIESVLSDLNRRPPSADELEQALNTHESYLIQSLESLSRRADRLQTYNHYLGDPDRLAWEVQSLRAVTVDDLIQAAKTYLGPKRITLRMAPKGAQK